MATSIPVARGRDPGPRGGCDPFDARSFEVLRGRADILLHVTAILETIVRRSAVVLGAATLVVLALAGPAGADVPVGWSDPEPVSVLPALLLLAGVPILLFVVIAGLALLPGLRRGERLTPGAARHEDEWFGGPRSGTAELAAPDTDQSEAGGASARW
jgi:hypothetical protein